MAVKKVFNTDKAPLPKGPYSQAVINNGLLYISGQIPVDPASGSIVRATIEEETMTVLDNIRTIVEEAGAKMDDVLKVTCFLADIEDFSRFNEVYERYFPKFPPARTALQAGKLPMDVQIEMDAIVALPFKRRRQTGDTRPPKR
ncbi:MAG: Rid family detoxifying hydrolase [Nitrospirota bacterium]|nr:Rid family detoxifying hydrolase [Nitrospirota bacterium]